MARPIRSVADLRRMIGHVWEDVGNFIIRPERATYRIEDLGPAIFRISDSDNTVYERTDLDLENMRGMKIKCSWYRPLNHAELDPMPCLVYLHGNCGCRWDGLEVLHLLRQKLTLFTYDACGSGQSDGEFVSLGAYERQDLACVVDHLQQPASRVSAIGLWGRSMGAVTALMYAARDKSIRAIVADSPFSSLRQLAADLVAQHGKWVPSLVVKTAVNKVRKSIAKRAHFDIDDLDAVKYARQCVAPAFIFHGESDDFVKAYHSEMVAEAYSGSCLYRTVPGDHNSERGTEVQDVAIPFLQLYLIDKIQEDRVRRASVAAAAATAAVEDAGGQQLSCSAAVAVEPPLPSGTITPVRRGVSPLDDTASGKSVPLSLDSPTEQWRDNEGLASGVEGGTVSSELMPGGNEGGAAAADGEGRQCTADAGAAVERAGGEERCSDEF